MMNTSFSANGSSAKRFFSRNSIRLSSSAFTSLVTPMSVCTVVMRLPARRMEATQSCARTGTASWKTRPSRSVSRQVRPSSSTRSPATICGRAISASSRL